MKKIHLNTDFIRKAMKCGVSAMVLFLCAAPVSAQDYDDEEEETIIEGASVAKKVEKPKKTYPMTEIQGKVVDAATGEPLAGVQVKSFNNPYYTAMTDEEGVYWISVPQFVTALQASLEGYNIVETAINGRTHNVDIRLYSDRYLNNYTSKVTASKSVKIDGFDNTTAISADQEIAAKLGADVRSIMRSSIPGAGVAMFINGINSLNSNAQPLFVIDGVVYDMLYDSEMLHFGYWNNLLSTINMDDVESIEVLKNGTAIYGSKAANGVINIKTKRNTSMATRIDFKASVGVELKPNTIDVLDAEGYRSYSSQMLGSTNTKLTDFKFLNTDPNYYYYNMYHNNTDWKDEVYREAVTQNYSLHIQGGDDVANYNLSVGYMNSQATLKKNDMNRFNIRFNTDIVLNKWFTTIFDASYTNITRNLRDAGLPVEMSSGLGSIASLNSLALMKAPFLSPYDFDVYGNVSHFIADADDYLNEVLGSSASIANPSAILKNGEAKNKSHTDLTQINVAIAPKWQPTRNFSLTERFSYTFQSFDERYYTPLVGMPQYTIPGSGYVQNANLSVFTRHNAVMSDTRADWNPLMGDHRIDVYGGVRFLNNAFKPQNVGGYTSANDKMPNISSSLLYKFLNGKDLSWRSLSYYANIDYNYKEKYYLQGQFSMETSSRFGKETDAGLKMFGVAWGFFPSIQGAWVISNEKWWKPNNFINFLKLNAGFESVGNDGVDNNATMTYMTATSLLGQNVTSIQLTNIGNTKLRWETTNRLNAGFEGNFASNRLNVKFNYFKSWTSNLISLSTLAYVSGLQDYWTNDGKLENEGFDVTVTSKLFDEKNFKMEVGASMGHYQNKVTQLPKNKNSFITEMYNGSIITELNKPVGMFYGYKTDGVFANSQAAEAANLSIVDNAGNETYFKAGDMKFVDLDNNGIINGNDRTVIGDPNPDIYGNIFANFFIGKHWSLGVNFSYSVGNDIYNYQRALLESGSQFINQTTALNRRWMAEGQQTDIPQITYGDPMGNSRFSDRWIEDGSYLKLKNVTLSYQIPITNEYIQGLSVWAAANNLFTITRYLGNDPEVSCGNSVLMQGIDAGYLNPGRSFTLGVKINL